MEAIIRNIMKLLSRAEKFISEMKNLLDMINSKVDIIEEKTKESEYITLDIIQKEG
jgi:hypothetical protein